MSVPADAPAQIAKAALRRLAQERAEPTPDNYARAFAIEAGEALPSPSSSSPSSASSHPASATNPAPASPAAPAAASIDGPALAALIDRVVRGVERGGRHWTAARRKDGLRRVLDGSRADADRLQQRLSQLVSSWETDTVDSTADSGFAELGPELPTAAAGPRDGDGPAAAATAPPPALPAVPAVGAATVPAAGAATAAAAGAATASSAGATTLSSAAAAGASVGSPAALPHGTPAAPWPGAAAVAPLAETVQAALPPLPGGRHPLVEELAGLTARLRAEGPTPGLVDAVRALCERAATVLQHRHHLIDQLGSLCMELTASLTDLAENDSWAQGQCQAMQAKIEEGLTARGVRAVSELLRDTRERHGQLRAERDNAREALKGLIGRMLSELDQLGSRTGNFHHSIGRYAEVIERADSLESLAGVVREMVEESRTVQALVRQTQGRLQEEHSRAAALSERVATLEDDMRRLSDEVSTDPLTQIANRRGLLQAFEGLKPAAGREGEPLAIGLLDIDNFKRLNDQLGHNAGDEALKALAAVVSQKLRPADRVARYGGEEFVVLLPATPLAEGQQILTRLQRGLTGGLFLHEEKTVFVTFSAGVTAYRPDEPIEAALERADQALYQAKRAGKNRTCAL